MSVVVDHLHIVGIRSEPALQHTIVHRIVCRHILQSHLESVAHLLGGDGGTEKELHGSDGAGAYIPCLGHECRVIDELRLAIGHIIGERVVVLSTVASEVGGTDARLRGATDELERGPTHSIVRVGDHGGITRDVARHTTETHQGVESLKGDTSCITHILFVVTFPYHSVDKCQRSAVHY